jgi:hypothetical protein
MGDVTYQGTEKFVDKLRDLKNELATAYIILEHRSEASEALAVSAAKLQIKSKFIHSKTVQTQLSGEISDFETLATRFQEALRIDKDSKQANFVARITSRESRGRGRGGYNNNNNNHNNQRGNNRGGYNNNQRGNNRGGYNNTNQRGNNRGGYNNNYSNSSQGTPTNSGNNNNAGTRRNVRAAGAANEQETEN